MTSSRSFAVGIRAKASSSPAIYSTWSAGRSTRYRPRASRAASARTAESVLAKVRKVIRAQTGTVFREGYNPRRECMMHTLAPLSRCWKPLLFYLGTQAVRAVAAALFASSRLCASLDQRPRLLASSGE